MSARGRLRAPFTLLTAGCLGLSVLIAAPVTASAASSAATGTTASTTASTSAASSRTPAVAVPKSTPAAQKLEANRPDYAPAGCNIPDPKPGEVSCEALVRTNTLHQAMTSATDPLPGALGPAQIQAAYDLPAGGGAGQTVAIVDANGDSSAESDLAVFRAAYGLPACTTANGCFRKTDETGGTNYPADDPGWGLETSLDLDAVSSACPECHILLVEANSPTDQDLGTAENTAVQLGAKFISNSFGEPDNASETSENYFDHAGVVVAAAAGDTGNQIIWPSADPDVVAVGGTTLTQDSTSARGWSESAWNSGGSGCSAFEPQPAYQVGLGTECANRATADISADADPASGLAVYDTEGQTGWAQVGGTSLATPLVTAMYAIAGDPAPGTYPVTYPYAHGGAHLNDVTQGSNGGCGNVQCNAGPGWDGPTGLGTPDGVGALTVGSLGDLTGRITTGSGATGVADASVVFTDAAQSMTFHTTTDAQGDFTVAAGVGDYTETVSDFGYGTATASGLQVTAGHTTTANLTIDTVPSETVSGVVTDGSGHGWPLYAQITVAGDPNQPVYTNPKTGAYSVKLPEQKTYSLTVTPVYQDYDPADATVSVGTSSTTHNISVDADQAACDAPGYAYPLQTGFEGWTGDTPQGGWTVAADDGSAHTWEFDNPGPWGNQTGGSGNYAAADSMDNGGATVDSDLVSPVIDLSRQSAPTLQFDTFYFATPTTVAEIDLSTDGGTTWTAVPDPFEADGAFGHYSVPLTQAAGKSDVRVRFHYDGAGATLWQLDDVSVGSCATVTGGLVEGTVTDGNTGRAIDGAVITDKADPQTIAASTATPADPNQPHGFYWLFSKGTGRHTYTTSADRYTTLTSTATTVPDSVVQADLTLQAGQLKVTPGTVSMSAALGRRSTHEITLTNTGRAPLHVTLGEQNSGSSTAAGTSTEAWQAIADYPEPIMDNAVGYYAGKLYSVGGAEVEANGISFVTDSFVYDPVSASWSAIAPLPQGLNSPSAAFLNGTLYVAGGWSNQNLPQSTVYAYHPTSNTWSQVASLPQGVADASVAVLDGYLYVIGGTNLATVYRYSPTANTWTSVAAYPEEMQDGACAGLGHEIVCAGGLTGTDGVDSAATYIYSPEKNTWTQAASMPYDDFGMASSGANGQLQIVGGVVEVPDQAPVHTDRAEQYDPVHNVWTALPDAIDALYRGGGASCGLFQIGGSGDSKATATGVPAGEVLPGFDQCGGDQVSWLSTGRRSVELAPGQSIRVPVTADASQIDAPGDYSAELTFTTDAPYISAPTTVGLNVTRPSSWGEVSGTVTAAGAGTVLPGATVQICAVHAVHNGQCGHPLYTVTTDSHGAYALWLPAGSQPLDVVAVVDGYTAQTEGTTVRKGGSSVIDFALAKS